MVHRGHKANQVRKVRQETMAKTELKDSRDRKVNPVLKGLQVKMEFKGHRGLRENPVLKDPQVKMELKGRKVLRGLRATQANRGPLARKALRAPKVRPVQRYTRPWWKPRFPPPHGRKTI